MRLLLTLCSGITPGGMGDHMQLEIEHRLAICKASTLFIYLGWNYSWRWSGNHVGCWGLNPSRLWARQIPYPLCYCSAPKASTLLVVLFLWLQPDILSISLYGPEALNQFSLSLSLSFNLSVSLCVYVCVCVCLLYVLTIVRVVQMFISSLDLQFTAGVFSLSTSCSHHYVYS